MLRAIVNSCRIFTGQQFRGFNTTSLLCRERSLNAVQILGRVGNDPKAFGPEDKQIVFFNVVTNEVFKKRQEDGTTLENVDTTWHSMAVRKLSLKKYVLGYIVKGSRVFCTGSIQNRVLINDDGTQRRLNNIILDDIIIIDDMRRRDGMREVFQEEDSTISSTNELYEDTRHQ